MDNTSLLKKLVIITTHPVQYNAPLFQLLADRRHIEVKVLYTWGQSKESIFDPGFGNSRLWDIPLLEGYQYEFLENTSKVPGSHHFKGIDNPGIVKAIENYDPDAILVYGWSFKSHLKVIRHFTGKIKILFRGDSTLLDEDPGFSFKKFLRRIFLKWIYSHIDQALFVGTANKAYYLKHGLKEEQLIFAPHAVDNRRFLTTELDDLRSRLGISGSAIVFLFAGKFEPKKSPLFLLEAFIKLNKKNTHLILVGNGALEDRLKAFIRQQAEEIKGRIHVLPFQNQSQMPGIYKAADVFVLPSQGPGETWGLSVNEAMACAKAVLISDKCGCYPDLVQPGQNGFIFKFDDLDELVDKMKIMTENKEKPLTMGQKSLDLIGNWSYENDAAIIESTID